MSNYAGFNSVKLTKPQRSEFDLSHLKRSSTRMGRLTPVMVTECIPGDTFQGSSDILLRLAPLLAPIYDNILLFVHFFFIPNRILWEDWEEFITGGRLGTGIDPVDAPIPPYIDLGEMLADDPTMLEKESLADYLGVPIFINLPGFLGPETYDGIHMDILPFAAYQRCWYDYYRDRNFVPDDVMTFPIPSGQQGALDSPWTQVRTRAYEHDYFTSALPFTQRGVEVLMPLAGSGAVNYYDRTRFYNATSPGDNLAAGLGDFGIPVGFPPGASVLTDADGDVARVENIESIDLTTSDVSINDWRSAYALQVWYERNAVAGSRYVESNLAHFAVRSQDSRLQRAEYIGGGRIPVKISEIVSTAYSEDGTGIVPLANLAGHGITYGNTNQFRYFCPEHGFIIGIASIMNKPSYHQGMPRMFRRRSFLAYPWPTFAKLGEQTVDRAELFASAANLTEDENGQLPLFGYQSRYADWKFIPNTNHGEFHDTLLFWTLTREFSTTPTLSEVFVTFDDETQNRIFAVNDSGTGNFWMYIHNQLTVRRCLPYFGTPNTLGFV